LRRWQHL